ncbi:polysaccharide deacetylase family protein [Paenibacillus arenosi]
MGLGFIIILIVLTNVAVGIMRSVSPEQLSVNEETVEVVTSAPPLAGRMETPPDNQNSTIEIETNVPSLTKKTEAPKSAQKSTSKSNKAVYLTFDDGPTSLTDDFLDLLMENEVQATFFMVGTNLNNVEWQDEVKRAVEEGHYVGAHSMTHDYNKLYKQGEFVDEMKESLALIGEITGVTPTLVRPPYGSKPGLKDSLRNEIADANLKVWDWTIDSKDWKLQGNPNGIVEQVKSTTTEDIEIVLLHEKETTLEALQDIIDFYKNEGYEFAVYQEGEHFMSNFWKDERL